MFFPSYLSWLELYFVVVSGLDVMFLAHALH